MDTAFGACHESGSPRKSGLFKRRRGHITSLHSQTASHLTKLSPMALHGYQHHHVVPPSLPDWGWDWDWELLGDAAREGIHGDAFPALPSLGEESSSSEASSGCGGGGCLEDAVAHWSKRQRTAAEAPPRCPAMASEDLQCLLQSFWDSSSGDGDLLHDLNNTMAPETSSGFASGEEDASGRQEGEGGRSGGEAGGGEAAAAAGPPPSFSATRPRPPLQKATAERGNYCEPASSSSCSSLAAAGGGRGAGVVYPFAVVKPLGLDGDTLSDVNRRILKRPERPVRHPVGQFACGPVVPSPRGPGLSGKAVVSLTRIRTGGKGTITIIRTRG